MGKKELTRSPRGTALIAAAAFVAGLAIPFLYLRWNAPRPDGRQSGAGMPESSGGEPASFPVVFVPSSPPGAAGPEEAPLLEARDVERIRGLAGRRARIRGRIFRVGHSSRSNTYFLDFGPSREALTAVIFASAVELFEKSRLPPKSLEGKEIEIQGEIRDHPQYGLEVVLESPAQLKVLK